MTATHMLPRDMQLTNENMYSRKVIDQYIDQEIRDNPDMEAKIQDGVFRLDQWRSGSYYDSKMERLAQLQGVDLEPLVRTIFIQVAYCQIPEMFTAVTGKLAGVLGMSERADGIKTIGEMLAVLCLTDAFDIVKEHEAASLKVQSHIPLSEQLLMYVEQSRYLPPMVCEPGDLGNNFESPYLTFNDCVILGKGNAHSEDVCLDVLNIQNQTPLALNLAFLSAVEEEPTFLFKDQRQVEQWHKFKRQSYEVYHLLAKQGNRFFLHHKVDKRGRIYDQGYHISTQGSSFKKSCVDFAETETVEGVPVTK